MTNVEHDKPRTTPIDKLIANPKIREVPTTTDFDEDGWAKLERTLRGPKPTDKWLHLDTTVVGYFVGEPYEVRHDDTVVWICNFGVATRVGDGGPDKWHGWEWDASHYVICGLPYFWHSVLKHKDLIRTSHFVIKRIGGNPHCTVEPIGPIATGGIPLCSRSEVNDLCWWATQQVPANALLDGVPVHADTKP